MAAGVVSCMFLFGVVFCAGLVSLTASYPSLCSHFSKVVGH